MNVIFNHNRNKLSITNTVKNISVPADSVVRNRENKLRSLENPNDVVYTIPTTAWDQGKPYMPIPFPAGTHLVTGAQQLHNAADIDIFGEYIIMTDARPEVEVWELDYHGCYQCQTGETVIDSGYLIHYSRGVYTLGCIAIHDKTDMYLIYELIVEQLYHNKTMRLTVV